MLFSSCRRYFSLSWVGIVKHPWEVGGIAIGLVGIAIGLVGIDYQDQASKKAESRMLERLEKQFGDKAIGKIEEIREKYKITHKALTRFLENIGEIDSDFDQETLITKLEEKAEEFVQLKARLKSFTSTDPEVVKLRKQANAALEAGKFDDVIAILQRAKALDIDVIDKQKVAARELETHTPKSCGKLCLTRRRRKTRSHPGKIPGSGKILC